MANSKRVAKQILHGMWKLGKGFYNVTSLLVWELKMAIQNHDRQAMIEEAEIRKRQTNDYETWLIEYNKGKAWEQGRIDAQVEKSAIRRSERNRADFFENIGRLEYGEEPKRKKRN
jgi:hypothetical protein